MDSDTAKPGRRMQRGKYIESGNLMAKIQTFKTTKNKNTKHKERAVPSFVTRNNRSITMTK